MKLKLYDIVFNKLLPASSVLIHGSDWSALKSCTTGIRELLAASHMPYYFTDYEKIVANTYRPVQKKVALFGYATWNSTEIINAFLHERRRQPTLVTCFDIIFETRSYAKTNFSHIVDLDKM